jgi:hypothetical protein
MSTTRTRLEIRIPIPNIRPDGARKKQSFFNGRVPGKSRRSGDQQDFPNGWIAMTSVVNTEST